MKIVPDYFPLRCAGVSCFYRVTRDRENEGQKQMLIQNLSDLLANSVHAMSSLTMVSFLPMIAALMIATLVSDRVA